MLLQVSQHAMVLCRTHACGRGIQQYGYLRDKIAEQTDIKDK